MRSYKSQGTKIPDEWDLESSKTHVYHNHNVVALPTRENEPQMYEYNVNEYTRSEYVGITVEQNKADIAYVAIMVEVDL